MSAPTPAHRRVVRVLYKTFVRTAKRIDSEAPHIFNHTAPLGGDETLRYVRRAFKSSRNLQWDSAETQRQVDSAFAVLRLCEERLAEGAVHVKTRLREMIAACASEPEFVERSALFVSKLIDPETDTQRAQALLDDLAASVRELVDDVQVPNLGLCDQLRQEAADAEAGVLEAAAAAMRPASRKVPAARGPSIIDQVVGDLPPSIAHARESGGLIDPGGEGGTLSDSEDNAVDCPRALRLIAAINKVLYDGSVLQPNVVDFYNPKNSDLVAVLRGQPGIPITLAAVFISVARRVGLVVHGVNVPQHFQMLVETTTGPIFVDPFNKGMVLSGEQMKSVLDMRGVPREFHARVLRPARTGTILERMVRNLVTVAQFEGDEGAAGKYQRTLQEISSFFANEQDHAAAPRAPQDEPSVGVVDR